MSVSLTDCGQERTVVDLANKGLGRDPGPPVRSAKATGAHIIVGAGYYLGGTHPLEPSI